MNTLSFESHEELIARKTDLEQRIKALSTLPLYPPPGYQLDRALLREYEIWLSEINKELVNRLMMQQAR